MQSIIVGGGVKMMSRNVKKDDESRQMECSYTELYLTII